MTMSKPDEETKDSVLPTGLSRPKRGAFPTPKEEIARATPFIPGLYVPDSDQASESLEGNPVLPMPVEKKE